MLSKVNSAAIVGLDAVPVEVEVDIASQGLPSFTKVGTQYRKITYFYIPTLQKVGVQCQNSKY